MPYPSHDDLNVWRRACLVAESFADELEASASRPGLLRRASATATRVAALLAESNCNPHLKNRLEMLFQAAALNSALLDEVDLLRASGQVPADECIRLKEETCGCMSSILGLIRTLRSSD